MREVYFFVSEKFADTGGVENHLFNLILNLSGFKVNIVCNDNNRELVAKRFGFISEIFSFGYQNSASCILDRAKFVLGISREAILHFHDYSSFMKYGFFAALLMRRCFITFHGWEGVFPPDRKIVLLRRAVNLLCFRSIEIGSFINIWYGTSSAATIYGGVSKCSNINDRYDYHDIFFVGRIAKDTGFLTFLEILRKSGCFKNIGIIGGDISHASPDMINRLNDLQREAGIYMQFYGWVEAPFERMPIKSRVFTSGYLGILEALLNGHHVFSSFENELKKDYLVLSPFSTQITIFDASGDIFSAPDESLPSLDFSKYSWKQVSRTYNELWQS